MSHIHSPTRGYRYTIRRGSGLFILCQAFGDASEELDKNIVPRLFIFINVCSGTGATRTKIMYKYLKPIMMLAIASVLFTSCGGDDPDNPADPGNTTENGSSTSNPSTPSDPSIERIVRDNVTVSRTYSDYTYTFVIKSKVKAKLPDANVSYGVGHNATFNQTTVNISVGNEAYYYSASGSSNNETITFRSPFWFYYVFVEKDDDKWTLSEMYYNSYMALVNKGYSNLSSDERALYNNLVDYLEEYDKEATEYYRPAIYVCVNNKFYKVS